MPQLLEERAKNEEAELELKDLRLELNAARFTLKVCVMCVCVCAVYVFVYVGMLGSIRRIFMHCTLTSPPPPFPLLTHTLIEQRHRAQGEPHSTGHDCDHGGAYSRRDGGQLPRAGDERVRIHGYRVV